MMRHLIAILEGIQMLNLEVNTQFRCFKGGGMKMAIVMNKGEGVVDGND